jgi:hypothetical protein
MAFEQNLKSGQVICKNQEPLSGMGDFFVSNNLCGDESDM